MPKALENPALTSICNWWATMGVEVDIDHLLKQQAAPRPTPVTPPAPQTSNKPAEKPNEKQWIEEAKTNAATCRTLEDLKVTIEAFEGCKLKEGANKTVVYDGTIGADLLVIGEGPGQHEDRQGIPFVGPAGKLLDNMLASINRSRAKNTLITNVNYWRPPGNRNPEADELAVCRPFVERLITLTQPKLILSVGAVASRSVLGTDITISRLRGQLCELRLNETKVYKVFPTFHPAYLLRRPQDKSKAWRDLLKVEEYLISM